jgi:hypothetical protein
MSDNDNTPNKTNSDVNRDDSTVETNPQSKLKELVDFLRNPKSSYKNTSELFAVSFAKIILVSMPKEIDIDRNKYDSAISGARLVLYNGLIAFVMTFFLDANIGYRLPKIAYGLSLSASMSIIFIGTDIQRSIEKNYDIKFFGDEVDNPVIHSVVKRYGGLMFFVLGFLILIFVLYLSSIPESGFSIPENIPLVITQISTETILDWVRASIFIFVAIAVFEPRELIYNALRYFIAPVIFILVIGYNMAASWGDFPAQIFFLTSILGFYLLYFLQMLKMMGESAAAGVRAARKPEEEIIDSG